MSNDEYKKRLEEYRDRIINNKIESFKSISLDERIDYINNLIKTNNVSSNFDIDLKIKYKRWLYILKSMSIKTIQINQLKEFYKNLDDKAKKEFQTELYETIDNCEWDWQWDDNVDDYDKILKEFYNFEAFESKIKKIKNEIIKDNKHDNQKNQEKLLSTFIENCSDKVIEDYKKSFEEYILLMNHNLSKSTKKRLFSLPAHMRIYAFMEMYNTAKLWDFNSNYLINNYAYREKIREEKKQQLKSQKDKIYNSKGYVKKKFPLIRPRI